MLGNSCRAWLYHGEQHRGATEAARATAGTEEGKNRRWGETLDRHKAGRGEASLGSSG